MCAGACYWLFLERKSQKGEMYVDKYFLKNVC